MPTTMHWRCAPRMLLRHVLAVAALAGAVALVTATARGQSVTVFGNSDAQQCYEKTQFQLTGTSALPFCTAALKAATLTDRDRAATLVNRGINFTRAQQHVKALADFEAALRLNPELAEAFLNRGNTYIFQNRFDLAITDYSQALALGTKEPHAAYYNRGLAYEALRNLDKAYQDFAQASALQPQWPLPEERLRTYEARGFAKAHE